MTYRMPSTVNDVSAMFVATITLRKPGDADSNTLICCSVGSAPYMGNMDSYSGTSWPERLLAAS